MNYAANFTEEERRAFEELQEFEAAKAVKGALPADCNENELNNIERAIVACLLGSAPFSAERAILSWKLLLGISMECMCWADLLEQAILSASITEDTRALMVGAYSKVLDMLFILRCVGMPPCH